MKLKLYLKQFIKYGLVGLTNTAVTLSIIYLLSNIFNVHYMISNGIGYIAGFINSFILNRSWTFKGSDGLWHHQFIKFLIVFAICYLLQLGFLYILVQKLILSENISQLFAMVLYTGISFIINKLFVFSSIRSRKESI